MQRMDRERRIKKKPLGFEGGDEVDERERSGEEPRIGLRLNPLPTLFGGNKQRPQNSDYLIICHLTSSGNFYFPRSLPPQ